MLKNASRIDYSLLVSPFTTSLLFILSTMSLMLIFVNFFIDNFDKNIIVGYIFLGLFVSFIILLISLYVIRHKKYTYISRSTFYSVRKCLVKLENDKVVEVNDEIIKGKENIFLINIGSQEIHRKLKFEIEDVTIFVPYTVSIEKKGDYDYQELYEKTVKNNISSVEDLIVKGIEASVGDSLDYLKIVVDGYNHLEISKEEFLHRLIKVVNLPSKIISNFKEITIKLNEPVSYAMKKI